MDNTYLLQSRRTEYLKKFQKTTSPLFIEGVYSIYNNVKKNNKSRRLLLKEFQQSMVDVSRWSQDIIKNEHMRFKKKSSVLDKLIRAIFDLDIILKKDLCKNAEDFIPHPWDFIHQCYLNIARALWKQPFLVYDVSIDKLTIQQNKLKIEKLVSLCIQDTFTQYLPLDIEHDDVSNIDYSLQNSNIKDLLEKEKDNEDVIETYTELSEDYGYNNDLITKDNDDLDVIKYYVSDCNDNFKKLDYEINSNLHENLNVFQNEIGNNEYIDDCDNKDNHKGNNGYEESDIHDTNSNILDEYVNVNPDDETIESNSDICEKESNDESCSDIIDEREVNESVINEDKSTENEELIDNEVIEYDNNNMSFDEEDDTNSEEMYETRSFHSEEVGDVDSMDSKELFISHYDDLKKSQEKFDTSATADNNINQNNPPEVKNIIIGENVTQHNKVESTHDVGVHYNQHQKDIKVINIDENKTRLSSKKDDLLSIKKKVKSSMYHSRDKRHGNSKYERYGDKIQVERKNMSFF